MDLIKDMNLGGFAAWRKGFEDESTIAMIQQRDLGKGVPKSADAIVNESVKTEEKSLSKVDAYKQRLEKKAKEKAAKKEAKRKAKEEAAKAKAEKKRLEQESIKVVKR